MDMVETNNAKLMAEVQALRQRVAELEQRELGEASRAHESLRDSEERLRAIYDQSNDAIFLLDLEHDRIVDFNRMAVNALGYSVQELLDVPVSVIHPHEMDLLRSFARLVRVDGGGRTEELTCVTKTGDRIPVELSASYVEIKGRSYLLALVRNITERKRAERVLQEVAAFADTNPAPVLKLDRQGVMQWLNPAASKLFADTAKVFEESWFALCSDVNRQAFERVIDEQGEIQHEMRVNDRWFQFTYKGSPETGFVYVYGADITALKQAEAQLRQVQKMDAIGQLAGGIAHDFNNILTAIFGYGHLLQQALPAQPDLHAHLERVLTAAERAKDLVKQILSFSRQSDIQRQPLALQTVIGEALSLLRAALPATIQIRTNIDPAGGMVMADSTEMHQVVMNLCTNAEHAMRAHGGVLEISLCDITLDASYAALHGVPEGRYVQLHIRDTGVGMSAETSERIFEPFFTTKPLGEGSGMGLSVVHGIVKRNEGAITVESVVGQGTSFMLLFPVIASRRTKTVVSAPSETLFGTEHILFVDDEPTLVKMYERMVKEYGYTVTICTSGAEALTLFQKFPNRFDLVVTDQTMVRLTGFVLAQEILSIRPDIPIVLCTGFSATVTSDMAASQGIRAFVMKPVIVSDLLQRIRNIFDGETYHPLG